MLLLQEKALGLPCFLDVMVPVCFAWFFVCLFFPESHLLRSALFAVTALPLPSHTQHFLSRGWGPLKHQEGHVSGMSITL